MTPAAPPEAPNENQLMAIGIVPMRLWDASGPPPMPTTGPPMPPADLPMPTASVSMPTPTVTMGPKMLPSTKMVPSAKLGGATSKAPAVPVIAVDVPDPVAVVSSSSDDDL